MIYAVVRVGKSVLFSKWNFEAKEEIRKVVDTGEVVDMIVYYVDKTPLAEYHRVLGEEITPFVLSLYGTVLSRSQGLDKTNLNEHIINIDSELTRKGSVFEE